MVTNVAIGLVAYILYVHRVYISIENRDGGN